MNNNPTKKVGLKMQNFSGSWFNDNFSQVYTTHPLQAIPVRCLDVPGPAFIDLEFGSKIETLPALSPLYDDWTLTTKFVFCPYRLYMEKLRINNVEDVGEFDDQMFPRLIFWGDQNEISRYALNPRRSTDEGILNRTAVPGGPDNPTTDGCFPAILRGSAFERLGYAPGELLTGSSFVTPFYRVSPALAKNPYDNVAPIKTHTIRIEFNFVPYLAYLDSWLYFEFNKQDKSIPVYNDRFDFMKGLTSSISYVDYDKLKSIVPCFAFGKVRNDDTDTLSSKEMHIGGTEGARYLRAERNGVTQLVEDFDLFTNCYADNYPYFREEDTTTFSSWSPSMLMTPWKIDGSNDVRDELAKYGDVYTYLRNSMSRAGLLPTTFNGDKFTSWFDAESIEKLRTYVIKTNMTFEQLRVSHSDYYMQVLSMVSGNKYTDYLQFVFDSALELKDHPIFVGSDTIRFNFMDVLNQSQGSSGEYNESLGSTGSKGYVGFNKGRPIKFKTREPGLLLCYSVLTPSVRYFQGENLFFSKREFSEVWHPQYRGRGFTNVKSSELYKFSVGNVASNSVNYVADASRDDDALSFVPIGWEYMNEENRLSGAMAFDYFKPWTLARDFNVVASTSYDSGIEDYNSLFTYNVPNVQQLVSTYGTDDSFNYNFANVGQDAENFIVKTEFNYSRYIPIGKQLIKPNL